MSSLNATLPQGVPPGSRNKIELIIFNQAVVDKVLSTRERCSIPVNGLVPDGNAGSDLSIRSFAAFQRFIEYYDEQGEESWEDVLNDSIGDPIHHTSYWKWENENPQGPAQVVEASKELMGMIKLGIPSWKYFFNYLILFNDASHLPEERMVVGPLLIGEQYERRFMTVRGDTQSTEPWLSLTFDRHISPTEWKEVYRDVKKYFDRLPKAPDTMRVQLAHEVAELTRQGKTSIQIQMTSPERFSSADSVRELRKFARLHNL